MQHRARWIPALVLVLGTAVGWFTHRTYRPLSRPTAVADVGIERAPAAAAAPTEPAEFLDEDPWLPGMPGYRDPFDRPLQGPSLDELTRDIGVDIRGIGDGKPGTLVNLDDVSSGLDNAGAGLPATACARRRAARSTRASSRTSAPQANASVGPPSCWASVATAR